MLKNHIIWVLDSVYVGNFYFIIALEYTHIMHLKTTDIIGFRRIYEIVFIKSSKTHNHLDLNVLYAFHLKIVFLFSMLY